MSERDVTAYLERIGFDAPIRHDLDTLALTGRQVANERVRIDGQAVALRNGDRLARDVA